LNFILSSFICQDSSFTLPPPQFPYSHLLTTGIKVSKQYWYWVWQPIKVLPNTQYYPVLENIGQYPNANIVLTLKINAISLKDKWTKIGTHTWIYIANKCTKFYAKRLSRSENIDETRRGSTFFDSPCTYICLFTTQVDKEK